MGAIEQAIKDLTAENEQMRRENASLRQAVEAMRQDVADIREAFDHLPPPSRPIDEAALSAKLTAVIDGKITQATTDITASVKKATKKPKISLENGNLAAFLAGLALLFSIITPFIAIRTSSISDIAEGTDRILWNQNYAGTPDKDGKPQTATPFTPRDPFYGWWNNQQNYLNSQQQPQQ